VSRPKRLNLLLVPSDGSPSWRINLPGWTFRAVAIAALVSAIALCALIVDYVRVRELARDPAALQRQVAAQQALIDTFQKRVGEIRLEVATWRNLHAKIWEPFGPDSGPARRGNGIGGARASTPTERSGVRPSVLDEVDRLAEAVNEEGRNLRALERLMMHAGKALAHLPSRWPVRGAINSAFGRRASPWAEGTEFHSGLDISADRGAPVHAPAPGTVVFAGAQIEFGLSVILDHGHEIRTLYGHLSKVSVSAGQQVERGQVVGLTGNTGKSTGPHLHYEILVKGQSVNPRAYLWD
jgi:murein DD-endopeptidase MepM/ murein hydrolase activator NlpD